MEEAGCAEAAGWTQRRGVSEVVTPVNGVIGGRGPGGSWMERGLAQRDRV